MLNMLCEKHLISFDITMDSVGSLKVVNYTHTYNDNTIVLIYSG